MTLFNTMEYRKWFGYDYERINKNLEITQQIINKHKKVKEQEAEFRKQLKMCRKTFYRYRGYLMGRYDDVSQTKERKRIPKSECYFCGTSEKLIVHHKDFNRKNNNEENLLVVCPNCHSKLHHQLRVSLKVLQSENV